MRERIREVKNLPCIDRFVISGLPSLREMVKRMEWRKVVGLNVEELNKTRDTCIIILVRDQYSVLICKR